jgi:RsmE family RNA methyltransferase
MNIILFKESPADNDIEIKGRYFKHLKYVLKASKGSTFRAGIINGNEGFIKIIKEKKDAYTVRFENNKIQSQRPSLEINRTIDIILALPRPKELKRIFRVIATLAVRKIYLIRAYRVEKAYFGSSVLKKASEFFLSGMEQGGHTLMPEIEIFSLFRPFVEDIFPRKCGQYGHIFFPQPSGRTPLPDGIKSYSEIAGIGSEKLTWDSNQKELLIFGPEGGWIQFEIEFWIKQIKRCNALKNFFITGLGAPILTSQTALIFLFSQVLLLKSQYVNKGKKQG